MERMAGKIRGHFALAVLATLLLAGCPASFADYVHPAAAERPVPADPPVPEIHRQGLRPDQAHLLDRFARAPRYDLTVEFLPSPQILAGRGTLEVMNTGPEPWHDLVLRLHANLPRLQARMHVYRIQVNGQEVPIASPTDDTVLRVPLPAPLLPGTWARIDMAWDLQYAIWSSDPDTYMLLGHSQGIVSLPHFFPILAVYEPGSGTVSGRWHDLAVPDYSDLTFSPIALIQVTAIFPREFVVVGSGTYLGGHQLDDRRVQHTWVTGPVRGFVLQASPDYLTESLQVDEVTLQIYFRAGEEAGSRKALDYAARALRVFEHRFGPYPYPTLILAASPLGIAGMEYSNLLQIGVRNFRDALYHMEFLVVHEVAHQWWYLLIHNDPVRYPWLDEGLTIQASSFYQEEVQGPAGRQLERSRWQAYVNRMATSHGPDWWQERPYPSYAHYYNDNYRRAALFLDEIRTVLGDDAFFAALRRYAEENRFGIVYPQDLLDLFRDQDTAALAAIEQAWFGAPPVYEAAGLP